MTSTMWSKGKAPVNCPRGSDGIGHARPGRAAVAVAAAPPFCAQGAERGTAAAAEAAPRPARSTDRRLKVRRSLIGRRSLILVGRVMQVSGAGRDGRVVSCTGMTFWVGGG